MENEELQNDLNLCLRRNMVFTYRGKKYKVALNITRQYMDSITVMDEPLNYFNNTADIDRANEYEIANFKKIEEYLKAEGFFDK